MLVVVSPAKKLDMKPVQGISETEPIFSNNAKELVDITKTLSVDDLKKLMDISPSLAQLNKERFSIFGNQDKKAAAFAFAGDTYKGLDTNSWSSDDVDWAQKYLRILSGLYGLLRPLDAIEPYRLEMGSKLKGSHGNSLYEYWGDKISKNLNNYGQEIGSKVIVNCASNEYFKVIKLSNLSLKIITPIFMELKDGKEKIISFYSKNARGAMARYIIQNRLVDPEKLKFFNLGGYSFNEKKSGYDKLVFLRNHS